MSRDRYFNNGMNLMGIDSSWQYVVKGIVVLLAVYIDYIKKEKSKNKRCVHY